MSNWVLCELDSDSVGLGFLLEVRPGEPLRHAVIEAIESPPDSGIVHFVAVDDNGQRWAQSRPVSEYVWAEA